MRNTKIKGHFDFATPPNPLFTPTLFSIMAGDSDQESSDYTNTIREYLKTQYRPYALKDLMLNLKLPLNKTKFMAILDSLVDSGNIISKTIGKSTYYVYKERFQSEPINEASMAALSLELVNLTNEYKELKLGMYL